MSSRSPFRTNPGFGAETDKLIARFRATIPLGRRVAVVCNHLGKRAAGSFHVIIGLPYLDLREVIYLRLADGSLKPIAKCMIVDIKGVDMSASSSRFLPPLPSDSPQFAEFEKLGAEGGQVVVSYYHRLPHDPALGDEINERGLLSYVFGRARPTRVPDIIEIDVAGAPDGLPRALRRDSVVSIRAMGVNEDTAEIMRGIAPPRGEGRHAPREAAAIAGPASGHMPTHRPSPLAIAEDRTEAEKKADGDG